MDNMELLLKELKASNLPKEQKVRIWDLATTCIIDAMQSKVDTIKESIDNLRPASFNGIVNRKNVA